MASLIPLARSFPQRAAVICRGLIHFRCVHSDAFRDEAAAGSSDASSPSTPSPRGAGRGKRAPGTDSTAVQPSDGKKSPESQADYPLTTKTSSTSSASSEGAEDSPLKAAAAPRKRIGEHKPPAEDLRGSGRGNRGESKAVQPPDVERRSAETQAERSSTPGAGDAVPRAAVTTPPKHIGEYRPRTQVHGAGRGRGALTPNTMGRPLPHDQPSAEPDTKSVDMLLFALQKLKPGTSTTTVTEPAEPKPGSKSGVTSSAETKSQTQVPGRPTSVAQPLSNKGQGTTGAKPRYVRMQNSQTVPLGLRSAPAYEPGIMGAKGPSVPDVAGVSRAVSRDVPREVGAGRGAKMAPGHFAPGPVGGLQSKRRGWRERADWVDSGVDGEEDEEVGEDWRNDEEGDEHEDGGGPFQSFSGLDPDLYDDIPVLEYEAAAREGKVKKLDHPWVKFWGGQVTPPSEMAESEKAHTVEGQMKWNWILHPPRYEDIDIKSDVDFSHLTNEVDKRHKYYEVFMSMVDTVAGNNSYSVKQKEASIQFMMKAFGMGPKYAHKGKSFIEESSPGPP